MYLINILPPNEVIGAALIHLFAGTFVAFMFLYLALFLLRPKLLISPYICRRGNKYWFKIVNKSLYHAFDVKIELFRMAPISHSGGRFNVDIHPVKLHTSDWTSINRFRRKYSEKDPFSLFAQTIFTEENIEIPLRENGTYLELQLTARHGLSGLADRFIMQFPNEAAIKAGDKFCFGQNLGTIPENQSF